MADMNAFAYCPGHSVIHAMDPRFKLAGLAGMSLAAVSGGPGGLSILLAFTILLAAAGRVPVVAMLRGMRLFFVFLLSIILVRGAVVQGPPALGGAAPWFSQTGLEQGLWIAVRLLSIVMAGAVFVATTRAGSVFSAVRWFFRFIPFVDGTRAAMMLSLMIRFIPVILDEAAKIKEAQKARGVENRKNPLVRTVKLAPPLVERTLGRAQDLAFALTARNFSPNPTQRGLCARSGDWLGLALVLCLCVVLRLFD